MTSISIMADAIGHPLLDKFITDLIIQILTMIAIAKEKGSRPVLYSPNVKVPQKRLVYYRMGDQLKDGVTISQISKGVGITRQTVYRIKK